MNLQLFRERKEGLVQNILFSKKGIKFIESHSLLVDQFLSDAYQESLSSADKTKGLSCAVVALGGYGRREVCLFSDIDLLFLFRDKIDSHFTTLFKDLLYPLWDLGYDVGYAARTIEESISMAREDLMIMSSYIDARLVTGDSDLYGDFVKGLRKKLFPKKKKAFLKWIQHDRLARKEKYGDASHLLEPHIKQGIGGLRDYHTMLWFAKLEAPFSERAGLERSGYLSYREFEELKTSLDFVFAVRNFLHYVSKRRNDRLFAEYQPAISHHWNSTNSKEVRAVERFMGNLHNAMFSIKYIATLFREKVRERGRGIRGFSLFRISCPLPDGLEVIDGKITFSSSEAVIANPLLLIQIFLYSERYSIPMMVEARRLIRELFRYLDLTGVKKREIYQHFFEILRSAGLETLEEMMDTGLLFQLFPELEHQKNKIQFGSYHIYPVDRHLLHTVGFLKRLETSKDKGEKELLRKILEEIKERKVPLLLAGLLHDVGKGYDSDHSALGEQIAGTIADRMELEPVQKETIKFLIRQHLLLLQTALYRDINDEKVVVGCARKIRSQEDLKLLYLLTWADAKATGPNAWNEWKSLLVRELFFKLMRMLDKNGLGTEDISFRIREKKNGVASLLAGSLATEEVEKFFDSVSPRYLLCCNPSQIAQDIVFYRSLDHQEFVWEVVLDHTRDCWTLKVCTKKELPLFHRLCGVLALNGLNILNARIFTIGNKTSLYVFDIARPADRLGEDAKWNKVKDNFENHLSGRLALDYRLARKISIGRSNGAEKYPTKPMTVTIDNNTSGFFTIIEVRCRDALGILYLIAKTLFEFQIDIRIAIITTMAELAVDVFYVRDRNGEKISDEGYLSEIQKAIAYAVENRL